MSEVLREVDRYRVGARLGEGAHGTVYLGHDPKLDREVAIKVIKEEVLADPDIRRRFHREAKSIARLHHPSILEVYDYSGEASETAFIVTELLHGQTLQSLVDERAETRPGRPLDAAVAAAAGHEICLALEHAHAQGIVHRDLKPDNVFIESDGRVVLCDFGIARAFGAKADTASGQKTQLLGSPLYMSPEQISDPDKLGPASDFFSLGSVLYFLVTGEHAFAEETVLGILKRIVAGAHPPLAQVRPDLPPRLIQTIEAMLRPDLATRLADATTVSDHLVEIVRDAGYPDPRRALKKTLGPEIEEHTRSGRETTRRLMSELATLVGNDATTGASTTTQVGAATTEQIGSAARKVTAINHQVPPRARWPFVAGGIAVLACAGAAFYAANAKPESVEVPVIATPVAAMPVIAASPPVTPTPTLPPPSTPPAAEKLPVIQVAKPKPKLAKAPPEPSEGTFKLIALPWGEVFIDQEKVGTTPAFRGKLLAVGHHRLKIVNPNFASVERDIEIHPNQDTRVTIDLEK